MANHTMREAKKELGKIKERRDCRKRHGGEILKFKQPPANRKCILKWQRREV